MSMYSLVLSLLLKRGNTEVRRKQNWRGDTALRRTGQATALSCYTIQQTDFMSRWVMPPLNEEFRNGSMRDEDLPFTTQVQSPGMSFSVGIRLEEYQLQLQWI